MFYAVGQWAAGMPQGCGVGAASVGLCSTVGNWRPRLSANRGRLLGVSLSKDRADPSAISAGPWAPGQERPIAF